MNEPGAFLVGAVSGAFLLFTILVMPFTELNSVWQQQAIERDYAQHCPDTGDFAWKGECDGS